MKILITICLCVTLFTQTETKAQTEFELDPSQSMIMTGKGPGQDATINPYYGKDCYAIVKNMGKRAFSIRVQQKDEIIKEIPISEGEIKKVTLLKGYELYLDPNAEGKTKATVAYEPIKK